MMTTEQMKELYATGEWICVRYLKEFDRFHIYKDPTFTYDENYKLIHKKHSEVLDHVLNGGSLNCLTNNWSHNSPVVVYLDTFIKSYHESATYKIIKDKPSLNSHYCLATKEHYDKLIEELDLCDSLEFDEHKGIFKYLFVKDNNVFLSGEGYKEKDTFISMHLHNNEWVFGSLEHVNDIDVVDIPKPVVECITREEAIRIYEETDFCSDMPLLERIFNYIEYLEANQKGK